MELNLMKYENICVISTIDLMNKIRAYHEVILNLKILILI